MRIKRFFELFDDEELKSRNEIEYLSGNFKDLGKTIQVGKYEEEISKLMTKITSLHYPFLQAFIDEIQSDSDENMSFGTFEIGTVYNEEEKYWTLVARSSDIAVALGLRVNGLNNYDMFLYYDDLNEPDNDEKNYGFEKDNIDYNELARVIKDYYIPFIKEAGFEALLNYNNDLTIKN